MWSRNQRQAAVRLFLRRVSMIAMLVIVVAASFGVWGTYEKMRESRELRAQTEAEQADLLEREKQLASDIANLKTNRGMEEALREHYALAAEGEHLIVIVDQPAPALQPATTTVFQKIKNFLFFW